LGLEEAPLSNLDDYDKVLIEIICKHSCRFYKQNQEEKEEDFRCGAYLVIKEMLKEGNMTDKQIREIYRNLQKKAQVYT